MIRSHELISYLFTHDKLVLPGIGTLLIIPQSARASHHEFKIYGPKTGFEIAETTQSELEEFINWLRSLLKLDEAALLKFIDDQALSYKLELEQNKYISLPSIGRLSRDEADKLQFEADKQLRLSLEYAYPDLPLNYFQPEPAELKLKDQLVADIKVDQKKKWIPWYFYLGGVLVTAFLLSMVISYFGGFSPFYNKEINQSPADNYELPSPGPDTGNIFESQDTLQDIMSDQTENQIDRVSPQTPDTKNTTPVTKPNPEINKPAVNTEKLTLRLEKSQTIRLQLSNPLIIIVGSFKKPSQVLEMIKTIESAGYQSYVSKYDGFYRSGIIFEVSPESPDSLLNDIKANIEKDAWILSE